MKLFVGLPTTDGRRWNSRAVGSLHHSGGLCVGLLEYTCSVLTYGFNQCYVAALNARKKGVTHFLLLHADVTPLRADWLRTLTTEMYRHEAAGCQILSVAVPIKDDAQRVSVARENPDDPWDPQVLTGADLLTRPVTFTEPGLLVNSGLLLVDIRQPWVEQVVFSVEDRLVRDEDGTFGAQCFPEDWNFSRQAASLGVPSWCTRRVPVVHMGTYGWRLGDGRPAD